MWYFVASTFKQDAWHHLPERCFFGKGMEWQRNEPEKRTAHFWHLPSPDIPLPLHSFAKKKTLRNPDARTASHAHAGTG